MLKFICLAFTIIFSSVTILPAQQKVITLYDGIAPGAESWTWPEAESDSNAWNSKLVYNVSKPTLTVFAPAANAATGTGIVICPGGAFFALSINTEGTEVAKWLVKKGVTCFVLKYRLGHILTNEPAKEISSKMGTPEFQKEASVIVPLAIEDGKKALAYVRNHAEEYGIDKNKIGIIGFSAGGTVATSAAFNYDAQNKPNFVGSIYPFFPPEYVNNIPADAPPLFIAAATNDGLQLAPHSSNLYQQWLVAKRPAEIHIYAEGNHGFGMREQHLPSDTWIDRFGDWMKMNGWLQLKNPPEWQKQYTQAQLDDMRKREDERVKNDWANFTRYKDANAALAKTTSTKPRVVFMGNSITDAWIRYDSSFFAGKNYIDRGISGQTTPQMLLRFRPDVIDLKPAVVVILAGINDIAGNTGPMTLEETFGNIVSMAQLAKENNIRVIISSVLPAYDFPWSPGKEPASKVAKLNEMLKNYAAKNNVIYLDYFNAMKDERNGLPEKLSHDGIHPTLEGYRVMEPLVETAIGEAMKNKP